jgi:hypothetical protein
MPTIHELAYELACHIGYANASLPIIEYVENIGKICTV